MSEASLNRISADATRSPAGTFLSVDLIALTEPGLAKLVLIRRENEPFAGSLTLPGGLLDALAGETIADAAHRILREKVGAETSSEPVVVDVVSDRNRDLRGHTVSVVVALRVPLVEGMVTVDPAELPMDMPFSHSTMARRALDLLNQRLLSDAETTYALLGRLTTAKDAFGLAAALGGHKESAVSQRLARSKLYRPTEKLAPGKGRPPTGWTADQ